MVQIIQDFIPAGYKNRPNKVNSCKYVTIHNTGNAEKGSNAKGHASYIKSDPCVNEPKSWHYTVDDSVIYQHLPDNGYAYHAGSSANTSSIGIEICMNTDGNLTIATDNAAWLTAELCKRHGIPIDNVVQHNYWTGKNCPQMIRAGKPYSWTAFINKVHKFMKEEEIVTQEQFNEMMEAYLKARGDRLVSSWAKSYWDIVCNSGLMDGTAPQALMTREQAAILFCKSAGVK